MNIRILIMSVLLCLLIACQRQEPTTTGFVCRSETGFVVDGKPYTFVGANFWYGPVLGSEGQGGDRLRLCRELDALHALGLDNLRVLVGSDGEQGVRTKVEPTLQKAPGVYNDTLLAGLDYLLMEMGKRGMKAVLYLNNSWEWSGGYGFYLEHAGAGKAPRPEEDGYEAYMRHVAKFATNEQAHELFFNYVRFIVSRQNRYTSLYYKDDPAIKAWQIGNEPRAFGEQQKQPFAKWLSLTSALIRSLDANHLISIGSEGIWGCEMDSALYRQISADPNIDYLTVHVWPYNWSWARGDSLIADVDIACSNTRDYLRPHFLIARELRKPLVVEEFGYPRDDMSYVPGTSTAGRDSYYDFIFSLMASESVVAGCNFWAWGGEVRPQHERWQIGDPYVGDPAQEPQGLNSVFLCDSTTLSIVRSYSHR
jgi:mannan endo-1,4-beta-mannosidase